MGAWGLLFSECRVSVWEDEKVEKDGRDGCATMWMYLMPLNCTGKIVKMIYFILCVFSPMKKNKTDISLTSFLCYFIYFLAELGLHCCMLLSVVVASRGLLFVMVHMLLTAVASFIVEHGL